MFITNLKKHPEFQKQSLKLIEDAFNYSDMNSFEVDFYPLFNKNNFSNCFVIVDNNEVLAHIGALSRTISLKEKNFTITMYGGIAVAKRAQGKGLFKKLMNHVLEQYKESTFHLLWSEKLDLYKKFDFHPCGELNVYNQKNTSIKENKFQVTKTLLKDISPIELEQLKKLYNSPQELRFNRSNEHWKQLENITSSDLFLIKQNNNIINYFFRSKGEDLTSVIHEYGNNSEEQIELMQTMGQVWTTRKLSNMDGNIFMTCIRIGKERYFKEFIHAYSKIEIKQLDHIKVSFSFNQEAHSYDLSEFILGVFGPGRFKELEVSPLYICGLDSI